MLLKKTIGSPNSNLDASGNQVDNNSDRQLITVLATNDVQMHTTTATPLKTLTNQTHSSMHSQPL